MGRHRSQRRGIHPDAKCPCLMLQFDRFVRACGCLLLIRVVLREFEAASVHHELSCTRSPFFYNVSNNEIQFSVSPCCSRIAWAESL